ncbi:protein of unknown function (DUF4344) [Spongiibacter sp. IMCC21906]|jgi:hypothetical protein|uniref:DUF4344 domain-containing metallopeptidase n=1 Tax=Spongiibacter sp. IMCC21906 TaxID=1620392 RepID=UPI00062DD7CF|nr:DUF4344 domain-containing metallopeptidase [Spongiibacter sp. IMCC21906]AKH70000.1 protein of unknown function (DUF4344) [Spongiibacter sp. IMCC21906]
MLSVHRYSKNLIIALLLSVFAVPAVASSINVVYDEATSRSSKRVQALFLDSNISSRLIEVAEQDWRIPDGLTLHFVDSDEPEMYYGAGNNEIVVSYAFLPDFQKQLKKVGIGNSKQERLETSLRFTQILMFMELGYAMFDKADVITTGRGEQESVAFMISTIMESDKRHGIDTFEVLGAFLALSHEASISPEGSEIRQYWGNRGLIMKPPYDEFCLIVGSATEKYQDLANQLKYSTERVSECQDKFANNNNSWMKQLQPFQRSKVSVAADL